MDCAEENSRERSRRDYYVGIILRRTSIILRRIILRSKFFKKGFSAEVSQITLSLANFFKVITPSTYFLKSPFNYMRRFTRFVAICAI